MWANKTTNLHRLIKFSGVFVFYFTRTIRQAWTSSQNPPQRYSVQYTCTYI